MAIKSKIAGRKVATNPAAPAMTVDVLADDVIRGLRRIGVLPSEAAAPDVALTITVMPGLAPLAKRFGVASYRPKLEAKRKK
jgi:hypothetical protein